MNRLSGFSLIEILVVITIIGLLIGLSAGTYSHFVTKGEIAETVSLIEELKTYAMSYSNERGDYPPSSFKNLGIVATDSTNEGIECFVAAIYSKAYREEHPGALRPSSDKHLKNTDEDVAEKNITTFGLPRLLEYIDSWGNPFIYIHNRDYGLPFHYLLYSESGELDVVEVKALNNSLTGSPYNQDSFQLISAGPDSIFGTDDDLANFDIEK